MSYSAYIDSNIGIASQVFCYTFGAAESQVTVSSDPIWVHGFVLGVTNAAPSSDFHLKNIDGTIIYTHLQSAGNRTLILNVPFLAYDGLVVENPQPGNTLTVTVLHSNIGR